MTSKKAEARQRCTYFSVLICQFLFLFSYFFSSGCHSLRLAPAVIDKAEKSEKEKVPPLPSQRSFPVAQFIFHSDFQLKQDEPLFRELADLREQVYEELQLPGTPKVVQVYLFEDRDRYERFMRGKYPDLPKRRAFFVAQPHSVGGPEDLLVYTFWGDRIREDLRHELTHALLHSVLKDVPLWLDEGLAEYFEVPPESGGINHQHLEQIRRANSGPLQPDLTHLEQLSKVEQMTPAEYREAWAWVHLMLRDRPEAKVVLVNYLQQLRVNPKPGPLQPGLEEIYPDLEDALSKHLLVLDTDKPKGKN